MNLSSKSLSPRFWVLTVLILGAAFSRLLPHPLNFSPIGAMGLFGAAFFAKRWQALLIPIGATFLSDLVLNNVVYAEYTTGFMAFYPGMGWQYAAYALIVLAGFAIFRSVKVQTILAGALSATVIFFLVSNFGAFLSNPVYPKTLSGLLTAYVAGLPFVQGTLLGDLFYSGVLFGAFALLKAGLPQLRLQKAQA